MKHVKVKGNVVMQNKGLDKSISFTVTLQTHRHHVTSMTRLGIVCTDDGGERKKNQQSRILY